MKCYYWWSPNARLLLGYMELCFVNQWLLVHLFIALALLVLFVVVNRKYGKDRGRG